MKVLFLSQIVPYPPHGGVLQRGYNIVRELGSHAEVHLLAFVHPDALPTPTTLEESRRELGKFCASIEYFPLWAKKSPVHKAAALAMGMVSPSPFGMIAHRSRAYERSIAAIRRKVPFDILHVDTIGLANFIDRANPGAATVLTHHNVESMLMARRAEVESRGWARTVLAREATKLETAERQISPEFDINIVMSPNDRDALLALAPAAATAVVPNGVDTIYFTPRPEGATPALIYGGGMNMFANKDAVMHFITDVWPAIRAARPDVEFLAVGQDPPPELQAAAARDPKIVVTGYVKDIRDYIGRAAVYVVPLRVGGGTRLKVLDAMAMGKAMVSTPVGCEGIAVSPGEHLVVAATPAAFAEQTLALLADAPRRAALGAAARSFVEREYSWPVVGQQLLAAYRQAMQIRTSQS